MNISEEHRLEIEAEQGAFSKVIDIYFPKKADRILDFCCGTANEEPALLQKYRRSELISLDYDGDMKKRARELGRKTVRQGDVSNLENYVKGKFDLIIGRNVPLNPSYYKSSVDIWPEFFEALPKFMTNDATLFLTLLRPDELIRAVKLLENYNITMKERNRVIVPSDNNAVMGDLKDDYIIIAKRNT